MYLLPAIDILDGQVVRLEKGRYDRVTVYNDDPVAQARAFEEAGADWIHVVDLNGARTGNPDNLSAIEAIMRKTLLSVEVGGGIRSMESLAKLEAAGVSRCVLGTTLVKNPEFTEQAIARFGNLLAAGIDAKDGEVAIAGWEQGSGMAVDDLVRRVAELGFRHLIYTDISRDGMQTGVDPAVYMHLSQVFGNPVIASGGVAGVADIDALGAAALSIEGIIAGRAVYEGSLDVAEGVTRCLEKTRSALAAKLSADPCGIGMDEDLERAVAAAEARAKAAAAQNKGE